MSGPALGSIVGVGRRSWEVDGTSGTLEEEIFSCVRSALDHAHLSIDDITGIVTASSDQLDGRSISLMLTSGSVGGPGRDIVNVSSASEHALVLGAMRTATGQQRIQLIVSWGCPAESDVLAAERLSFEPYFSRDLWATRFAVQAMGASRYVGQYGFDIGRSDEFLDAVSPERDKSQEDPGWLCWPLRKEDVPPIVNRATALVLADPEAVVDLGLREARIAGVGWESRSYWFQDRQFDTASAGAAAVRRALVSSGASLEQLAATEWHFLDPFHAFATVESLDLAAPGQGMGWFRSQVSAGMLGSSYSGDSIFGTGLDRVASLTERLLGSAAPAVVHDRNHVLALAHAVNGIGGQGGSAFILEVRE